MEMQAFLGGTVEGARTLQPGVALRPRGLWSAHGVQAPPPPGHVRMRSDQAVGRQCLREGAVTPAGPLGREAETMPTGATV